MQKQQRQSVQAALAGGTSQLKSARTSASNLHPVGSVANLLQHPPYRSDNTINPRQYRAAASPHHPIQDQPAAARGVQLLDFVKGVVA